MSVDSRQDAIYHARRRPDARGLAAQSPSSPKTSTCRSPGSAIATPARWALPSMLSTPSNPATGAATLGDGLWIGRRKQARKQRTHRTTRFSGEPERRLCRYVIVGKVGIVSASTSVRLRLVLGSGGIRPVAAVPLLEFLEAQGITVDEIVGCSGGAVVGALYAAGLSGREVRRTIQRVLQPNFFTALDPAAPRLALEMLRRRRPPAGILRPDRIHAASRDVFGDLRLESLPRRLLLQATELNSRQGVVLRKGPLTDALYASNAAYPLLPPIQFDGRWLIDGAFSAPLPLLASPGPAYLTVAISSNPSGSADIADRLLGFAPEIDVARDLGADHGGNVIVIRLPIARRVRFWDMHLIPDLLALGGRVVAEHGAAIITALRNVGAEEQPLRTAGPVGRAPTALQTGGMLA
jgi:NTE family protein